MRKNEKKIRMRKREMKKTNRRRRIILDNDNASSHASAQKNTFQSTQNIEFMGHPPHSPGLAPNDKYKINREVKDFRRLKSYLFGVEKGL